MFSLYPAIGKFGEKCLIDFKNENFFRQLLKSWCAPEPYTNKTKATCGRRNTNLSFENPKMHIHHIHQLIFDQRAKNT